MQSAVVMGKGARYVRAQARAALEAAAWQRRGWVSANRLRQNELPAMVRHERLS